MDNRISMPSCCCQEQPAQPVYKKGFSARKAINAVPSLLLSIVVAFFPKCPFCWSVYMSMFGCVGLSGLPYMGWLLPVLLIFMALHLFMLYRKAARNGYLPFLLSLAGVLVILAGRAFFPAERWLLITGVVAMLCGSLLNNFYAFRWKRPQYS